MSDKEIVPVPLQLGICARYKPRLVTLNTLKFNVHMCASSNVKLILIGTWTIWRGCTDRVGKFPRPWMGTASPKIESKRCTWSQVKTQNRRLWSEASPQDMVMLTQFPKEEKGDNQGKLWKSGELSPVSSTSEVYSRRCRFWARGCRVWGGQLSGEALRGGSSLPSVEIRSVCNEAIHKKV